MSHESLFKAVIETDLALTGYLTGGVYTVDELGMGGLVSNNTVCAQAFNLQYGIPMIRPCMVVRERTFTPTYQRHDTDTQQTAYDGVVEFWCYQYEGYDQIDLMAQRLYALFNNRTYEGLGLVRPINSLPRQRSPEFENTSLRREDYQFRKMRT